LKKALYILLILCPGILFSQSFKVNLSPKHEQKLGHVKSGHKRMMKYYKYHKKDSAQHSKKKNKQYKKELDSLRKTEAKGKKLSEELAKRGIKNDVQMAYAEKLQAEVKQLNVALKDSTASDSAKQVAKKRMKEISNDKVNQTLATTGHPYKTKFQESQRLKNELKGYFAISKDSCASDSVRKVAREKAKELALQQAMGNPKFKGLYEHYKQNGKNPDWEVIGQQVPGMDSLQGIFDSNPDELMQGAEDMASNTLAQESGLGDLNEKTGAMNEALEQQKSLLDPKNLQNQGKKEAIDHFANHSGKVQGAQAKMGSLLGKYKEFTNSGDLSDAVKRTSLEGKTFKERIVLGGNFNIVSTDPIAVDLSPLIGYRINSKFFMGLSMNFRQTFGTVDSLNFNWYVSPTNTSFRIFANYDLIKNFYASAEWEISGSKNQKTSIESAKKWNNNYFIGLGKKILIHPKLFMTVTALYNLNSEKRNPTHPQRFQMRIGFQTSDLAFRKRKVYYNP
jgi:hypothetical protein